MSNPLYHGTMKTREILLQAKAANRALEMFDSCNLPFNIHRGSSVQTNDARHSVMVPLTLEYEEKRESLVEWFIEEITAED